MSLSPFPVFLLPSRFLVDPPPPPPPSPRPSTPRLVPFRDFKSSRCRLSPLQHRCRSRDIIHPGRRTEFRDQKFPPFFFFFFFSLSLSLSLFFRSSTPNIRLLRARFPTIHHRPTHPTVRATRRFGVSASRALEKRNDSTLATTINFNVFQIIKIYSCRRYFNEPRRASRRGANRTNYTYNDLFKFISRVNLSSPPTLTEQQQQQKKEEETWPSVIPPEIFRNCLARPLLSFLALFFPPPLRSSREPVRYPAFIVQTFSDRSERGRGRERKREREKSARRSPPRRRYFHDRAMI